MQVQLRSHCMSDLEGAILSEYLLLKCISKGGTADVYRARQQSGGNYEVAVKVFRPGYAQRKSFRDYFIAADGHVLLSDFGIARGYDDSQQSLTRVGWGSAEYAAPEQSLGVLRRSSDIYASGVLLFRMLAGQPPFTGQTPVEVLLKHVRQQPPSVRMFAPNISEAVNAVLAKAMQKRSDDRFGSARELSDALTAAVNFAPVASPVAKPVSTLQERVSTVPLLPPSLADPQTPPPAHMDFAPWFTPPVSPEPSSPAPFATMPHTNRGEDFGGFTAAPTTQPLTGNLMPDPQLSRGSENFDAHSNFLQENDDFGTNIFEWIGPVEWSPLGNGQSLPSPESAGEYLRSIR